MKKLWIKLFLLLILVTTCVCEGQAQNKNITVVADCLGIPGASSILESINKIHGLLKTNNTNLDAVLKSKTEPWLSGFCKTFIMIILMELGDKTFFIAAILAMTHNRWFVFFGSVSALIVMCIISCIIGQSAPILFSREGSVVIAAVLFVFFGVCMLIEGIRNKDTDVRVEYEEAEESVNSHLNSNGSGVLSDAEIGLISSKTAKRKSQWTMNNILVRTFVMVFFAEWGDRSQFSTILLAGTNYVSSVILGASCGYIVASLCAILGGHYFAKILSPKIIKISGFPFLCSLCVGGVLFLLFAIQITIFKD